MVHRFISLLAALALTLCLAASAVASPTATATKVTAQAAQAAKSCKKATARAAKARTPAKAKKLKKAKKKACKKAKALAAKAVASREATPTAAAKTEDTSTSYTPTSSINPADGELRTGLVGNFQGHSGAGLQDLHERAATTGVGWTREEIMWAQVQATPNSWDWSHYDEVFKSAAEHGLRVLPQLDETPSWAGANWNTVPTDPTAFAMFAARAVARYGPGGTFWDANPQIAAFAPTHFEIWNEAYYAPGGSDSYDPGRYARLVRATAIAGRAANPAAKYLIGAETTGRMSGSTWVSWTDAMYAAVPDLNNYFDALAIHPYGKDMTGLQGEGFGQFRRIEKLRDKFVSRGAADKPFWLTELGWATCTQSSDCVSEAQQAANVRKAYELVRGSYSGFVEAIFMYHFQDWGPADQTNKEYWFGLNRRDGSEKPAIAALRTEAGFTS